MEIISLRPRPSQIVFFSILFLNIMNLQCTEINFTINPNCENDCTIESGCDPVNCEKPWLIYGVGENGNDYIHYLWGFMYLPTFIMISSTNDSEMIIDWAAFTSGNKDSILFHPQPKSIFGLSFQSLILFDDFNDTGTLENIPEKSRKVLSMADFDWILKNVEKNNSEDWSFIFKSSMFKGDTLSDDDGIVFQVTSDGISGRSEFLPHLITTSKNSQVELVLNNLLNVVNDSVIRNSSTSKFLRFGVDAIIFSSDLGKNFTYSYKKSLDDEFTPGVFDLIDVASQSALVSSPEINKGGYMQWKPVSYLTPERNINIATTPNFNSTLPPIDAHHLNNSYKSLVYALLGDSTNKLLGAQTTVSFGQPKDGFYIKNNYTEWTFSMGLGMLPEETFSNLVIIVICVGVGLPIVLVLLGGIYLCVKKARRSEVPLLGED